MGRFKGDNKMDIDRFMQKLLSFYAYNFDLNKMPLEITHDEKLDIKYAVMDEKENRDNVMLVTAGSSLIHKEPPVEVVISASKTYLQDKEGLKLIKDLQKELMEQEYDIDYFDGSSSYPQIFLLSKEFDNHFGKMAYMLLIRNGGDPVFIETDDEQEVCFVIQPIFFDKHQLDVLLDLQDEDIDAFYDYLFELDDDNCSILK